MSRIAKYISEGEHVQQDFKMRIDDARKISKTISAFANTLGGRILIGVKDNGMTCAIDPEQEKHMTDGAAALYCSPPAVLEYTLWTMDNRQVLEAYVHPAVPKPVFALPEPLVQEAYYRVDDRNEKASRIQVLIWQKRSEERGDHFRYSEREQRIFSLLREQGASGFKKIAKVAGISGRHAESTLAKLVMWGVLDMTRHHEGFRFSLRPEPRKAS